MPLTPPPQIETARTVLRPYDRAHLEGLGALHRDDEATRFLPTPTWKDSADAERWDARISQRLAEGNTIQFTIFDKADGATVGVCLLFKYDEESRRAELGYAIARPYWGGGYAREATEALLDYGFGTLGLRRVEAEIDPRNTASEGLLLRLGFTREGLLRERWDGRRGISDSGLYGLLAREWAARQAGSHG